MGTWGHGYFENDSALDWLADADADSLAQAFDRAATTEYVDADDGSAAVAAAAVVAVASGADIELPEGARELARSILVTSALRGQAARALSAVLGASSELNDLWEGNPEWTGSVQRLLQTMTDSGNGG